LTVASDLEKRAARTTQGGGASQAAVWNALAPHVARLRVRRGQSLSLAAEGEEPVFILRSGALLLQLSLPGTARQVVALMLSGDMVKSNFVAREAGASLVAANAVEIWRLRSAVLDELAAADARLRRFLEDAVAVAFAQRDIHLTAIGRFSGEQRVATVLIDLALRAGTASPGGALVLDMPFSRTDIADYLGLNPDTLSRIVSRFRSAGILGPSERNRIILRDFRALAALTPASRSLAELHGERRGEPTALTR
jgi:CRP/FNR family transcriptional regulator